MREKNLIKKTAYFHLPGLFEFYEFHNIFGKTAKYVELVCFQVSEPYRGKKIGKKLFCKACEEAKRLGADKLYISAHSSKES